MSRVKQNSRLFEHEAYSSTSILLIYHSGLSFPKKLYFLKHRDLLACVVIQYKYNTKTLFKHDNC